MTVNETTIRYKMMNVTNIVAGTDHLNVSVKMPYTNQSDYEANGVDGSHWSGSMNYNFKMLDGNSTTWFPGFYCKTGINMLQLLTFGDRDKYNAFANMHVLPVPELLVIFMVMGFAKSSPGYWELGSATFSLTLLSYVSGTLNIAFGYQSGGHWINTTITCSSSFTYSVWSNLLQSADITFDMTEVSWNSGLGSYETESARSRHVYAAVSPSDLASYIPVEWFIGIGGGALLVIIIAVAIHKHKKIKK
jgi:hypothetical protein